MSRLDFDIRPAAPFDRNDLLALIAEHARFEGSEATLTGDALERIITMPNPPATILVAVQQRNLLGFAALTYDFSLWRGHRWAHLDCLFVSGGHRGLSIGGQLLRHAIQLAREEGADRIEWQTPEWNRRAIAFYDRHGTTGQPKMRFGMDL